MPDVNFTLILPELILAIFGLAILVADLIWREKGRHALAWLSLLGFVLAFAATISIWGVNASLFANMYVVDLFSTFFKLLAAITGILIVLVSIDYLRARTPYRGEFFALFTFAILAMMMMASSASLLMIYLSIEFLSFMSYLLTGFLREDKKSNEAAIKYFLYGAITSAVMLYGLSLLYGISGSLNLNDIARAFASSVDPTTRVVALVSTALVIAGLGFKLSLVPFHQWAPDVYEGAPTPITAFLSVGSKAVGFAVLLRLIMVALPQLIAPLPNPLVKELPPLIWLLTFVSIVTMTLGNLVALRQSNVKRMLAYSSIAQAGYILIGVVALNLKDTSAFAGLNAVLIYIFAYLFTNLGAFVCVIAIENTTGIVEIPQYAGLVKRAPLVAALFVLFFLSLAGIPPTAGFIGKFFVFGAALREGHLLLATVGVINSVVSVFYYFTVVRAAFFEEAKDATPIRLAPAVTFSLVVSAAMVLLVAVYPEPLLNLAAWSMGMVK
ncbi:MAG: NADH-quinone oxidoreductase subunit N [Chloroflexi bacterium]|nr:NADH-quinone oxidoreductase subunit N [Chloroflexota bacterium]